MPESKTEARIPLIQRQKVFLTNEEIIQRILTICEEVARGEKKVAICLYGSRICGYPRPDSDYDVLLILSDYQDGVRYHYRRLNGLYAAILAVDSQLLELDAAKGSLGDFVTGRLLLPYQSLYGAEYLRRIEIKTKKRIILEELEDLILEHGELSRGLLIAPTYFALSRMRKRALTYPPLKYSYVNILREDIRDRNLEIAINGYEQAIEELTKENLIAREDASVAPSEEMIDKTLSRGRMERVVNIAQLSQRALSGYLAHGRAGVMSVDVAARELSTKLRRQLQLIVAKQDIEDPRNYLYIKTSKGLTNLAQRTPIMEVAKKLRPGEIITLVPLGGVLNEVYLVSAGSEKIVAKRFTNWHGFKWFTLNLVALGTRAFALSGKARLANEYGMNRLLSQNKIRVPNIIDANIPERTIFEDFVEGPTIAEIMKQIFAAAEDDKGAIERGATAGRVLGRVHREKITLGDTKPENFIFMDNQEIACLDLEQARRGGDYAWDIAEFLYYSGHYGVNMTPPFNSFVKSFIESYTQVAEVTSLRKASAISYTKIFSFWTPPSIILGITRQLKQAT